MIFVKACWHEPFEELRLGVKPFDVRDWGGTQMREPRGGDVLRVYETTRQGMALTGRLMDLAITYVLLFRETPTQYKLADKGQIVVMAVTKLREWVVDAGELREAFSERGPWDALS